MFDIKFGLHAATHPDIVKQRALKNWEAIKSELKLPGLTRVILENCTIVEWHNGKVGLQLGAEQKLLLNDKHVQRINEGLANLFNTPIELTIYTIEEIPTPADAVPPLSNTCKEQLYIHQNFFNKISAALAVQPMDATALVGVRKAFLDCYLQLKALHGDLDVI